MSGSRWTKDNYITRCHRRLGTVPVGVGVSWGDRMLAWESACRLGACGPQGPTAEQPQPRWGRSPAMVRRTLGQYVTVCHRLHLTSHIQPTSTLSRIKCERYIFIKKWVRSFLEVVIIVDYVSAYICICMWLYNTTFACPCEGVHMSTLHMSSSLLLQQCPTGLVHIIRMVFKMDGRWPYSCCFAGCCPQNLISTTRNIIV